MSATPDAPQDERPASLAAALEAEDAGNGWGDTPAADAVPETQPERQGEQAPAPAAPTPIDEDADDETAEVAERIARAERRAAKQSQAQIEAARQERIEAQRLAASYKGNLQQEQRRREAIEKERDEAKRLATDADARENNRWEQLIQQTSDPELRQQYSQMYAADKDQRTLAREKADWALQKQLREEQDTRTRTEMNQQIESTIRASAIGEIATAVERAAADMGLPPDEISDIQAYLRSDDVRLNAENLSIPQLHQYRETVLQRVDGALHQRAQAFQSRQLAANRDEGKQVYRGERPVGGGGNARPDTSRYRGKGHGAIAAVLDIEDGFEPD